VFTYISLIPVLPGQKNPLGQVIVLLAPVALSQIAPSMQESLSVILVKPVLEHKRPSGHEIHSDLSLNPLSIENVPTGQIDQALDSEEDL